jgi:Zn-dependent M28 family amino/carboxypeptidase
MKRWIWLLLLVLGVMTVMGIGGFFLPSQELPIVKASSETRQQQIKYPQVSSSKLFAHIQQLNFKRFAEKERSLSRNYITSELRKNGWKPQLESFAEGVNIFAEREGTDKNAGAILVAAHYDTVAISSGADDNASGVAVVLEVGRLLGSRVTPRTLQLAFFDKEEIGLLGSKAFVASSAHLKNFGGAIVMDMVGYTCHTPGCQKYPAGLPINAPSNKGDFLAVVGDAEHLPLLDAFFVRGGESNLPRVLRLPVPLKGVLTPDTLRSDHAPFWLQGVGAVLITDTANLRNINYHQPGDKPTEIDRKFFNGAAQIVVNATAKLLESRTSLNTPSLN